MKLWKYTVLVGMLCLLVVAAGCSQDGQGGASSSSSGSSASSTEKNTTPKAGTDSSELTLKLYYPNEDGSRLLPVVKKTKLEKGQNAYTVAIKTLLETEPGTGKMRIIPQGTQLRNVKLVNGVARVDFSKDLVKKFNGGSTGELMLVGSIVDTLTEFPEVKSVQLMVEGQEIETIAGHMDTAAPLKRMEKLLK